MNKKKIAALFGIGIIVTIVNLILGLLFIKVLWGTIAESLFPKLIESGQISSTMSWLDAFWIGVLLYVVIRAFSGNLFVVKRDDNSTTISLGDSNSTVDNRKSKDKN